MIQHLATFNEIPFTKGGFSGTECTKNRFRFGRGSTRTPLGGCMIRYTPTKLERVIPPPHTPSHPLSRCAVQYLNIVTWQLYPGNEMGEGVFCKKSEKWGCFL